MKKLFILPILLIFVLGMSSTALAYGSYLGNSCYNCHQGSFGYSNSYSSYSYNSQVVSGWYPVNLKYHFPNNNFYGGYGSFGGYGGYGSSFGYGTGYGGYGGGYLSGAHGSRYY